MTRLAVFVFFLASSAVAIEPALPPERLCGPDIVTVGDAWENVKVECHEMRRMLDSGALVRWPQRMAALVSHLRFMQRRQAGGGPAQFEQMSTAVRVVAERQALTNRLALSGDAAALRRELEQIEAAVKMVGQQFPPDVLEPVTRLSHLLAPGEPMLEASLASEPRIVAGQPARVVVKLALHGDAVKAGDLLEDQGATVHAFVVDGALAEFHHVLPPAAGEGGAFECTFTPRGAGPHRLWIGATPARTGRPELTSLALGREKSAPPERSETLIAAEDDFRAELRFEGGGPREGELVAGKLIFTASDGQPLKNLEPIFGAFAHLIAFAADSPNAISMRPAGVARRADLRAGPEILFRFRPGASGFHRLFAEVRINGRVRTVAFGFEVAPAK